MNEKKHIKLVMNGALGRMGRKIISLASKDPDIAITGAVDLNDELVGQDIGQIIGIGTLGVSLVNDLSRAITRDNVVVDFTGPKTTLAAASLCKKTKTPLVIGTTGLNSEEYKELKRLVSSIPCVFAPNMSVGVNLLFKLAGVTARILGNEYDVEITETHHRFKKDAPSGTAHHLGEIIAETLSRNLDEQAVYGRHGIIGERTTGEIGIHSLRVGDVVGEHTVTFGTPGERIELTHKAQSRDAFARGTIRAVKFVFNADPGLYDMQDVLGLK
ncbi:4-hydroxy-tetrahydrodipicolinate reductase [Candidatus Latescibacterota bacterium]